MILEACQESPNIEVLCWSVHSPHSCKAKPLGWRKVIERIWNISFEGAQRAIERLWVQSITVHVYTAFVERGVLVWLLIQKVKRQIASHRKRA
jgi:hypothetical protein